MKRSGNWNWWQKRLVRSGDKGKGVRVSRFRVALLGAALLVAGCARQSSPSTAAPARAGWVDEQRVAHAQAGDWLMNGRTHEQQRFSPLTQITAANVERLGFAWEFRNFIVRGRTRYGIESNPLVVDGVMYFSGPWGTAYAVDAHDGRPLWSFDPHANGNSARTACCGVVNRGLAVWKGKVYVGSLDGFLVALDARSGQERWRVDTIFDHTMPNTITGAPYVAGDNILIGNAGADIGGRGYVSAYEAQSGKLVWRFFAVPGDPAKGPDETPDVTLARKTWSADTRWDMGGGGNAWDSMAYDPQLGLAYIGVGNGGPHPRWVRSPGGGDNLFVSSIVALDAKTGRMKWYYQETPGDSWDFASTQHLMLADIPWQGKTRKVIMQAPKNGMFYVLDRQSGELLKADPYVTVNWNEGVDLKSGRPRMSERADYSQHARIVWPSAAGGHGWQPMAFNPDTGLVYLQTYEAPMRYQLAPLVQPLRGVLNQGEATQFAPFPKEDAAELAGQPQPRFEGRLKAWNPTTGTVAWQSGTLPFVSGGVLATASGLVFQGATDGTISVYDARSGRVLKQLFIGTAIMGAPITYALDGKQYVAVSAGAGGPQGASFGPDVAAFKYENFDRVIAFQLDGGAVPLPPPAQRPPAQPAPPPMPVDAAVTHEGEMLFRTHCQRCHIMGGAFGVYPNLWNLSAGTLAAFEDIVYGGAYREGGMAAFSDMLSKSQVQAIKAFIVNDWNEKARLGAQAGASSQAAYH